MGRNFCEALLELVDESTFSTNHNELKILYPEGRLDDSDSDEGSEFGGGNESDDDSLLYDEKGVAVASENESTKKIKKDKSKPIVSKIPSRVPNAISRSKSSIPVPQKNLVKFLSEKIIVPSIAVPTQSSNHTTSSRKPQQLVPPVIHDYSHVQSKLFRQEKVQEKVDSFVEGPISANHFYPTQSVSTKHAPELIVSNIMEQNVDALDQHRTSQPKQHQPIRRIISGRSISPAVEFTKPLLSSRISSHGNSPKIDSSRPSVRVNSGGAESSSLLSRKLSDDSYVRPSLFRADSTGSTKSDDSVDDPVPLGSVSSAWNTEVCKSKTEKLDRSYPWIVGSNKDVGIKHGLVDESPVSVSSKLAYLKIQSKNLAKFGMHANSSDNSPKNSPKTSPKIINRHISPQSTFGNFADRSKSTETSQSSSFVSAIGMLTLQSKSLVYGKKESSIQSNNGIKVPSLLITSKSTSPTSGVQSGRVNLSARSSYVKDEDLISPQHVIDAITRSKGKNSL